MGRTTYVLGLFDLFFGKVVGDMAYRDYLCYRLQASRLEPVPLRSSCDSRKKPTTIRGYLVSLSNRCYLTNATRLYNISNNANTSSSGTCGKTASPTS